jgi:hypothetical protein
MVVPVVREAVAIGEWRRGLRIGSGALGGRASGPAAGEIESRLRILLAHLLKWRYQPALQSRSWRATITTQQQEVMALLEDSPSLRPRLQSRWQEVYSRARTLAEDEIGIASLPNESPWTLDQVLRGEYFANE